MEFSRARNRQTNYRFVSSILTVLGIYAFGNAVVGTAKENDFILNKDMKAFLMVIIE